MGDQLPDQVDHREREDGHQIPHEMTPRADQAREVFPYPLEVTEGPRNHEGRQHRYRNRKDRQCLPAHPHLGKLVLCLQDVDRQSHQPDHPEDDPPPTCECRTALRPEPANDQHPDQHRRVHGHPSAIEGKHRHNGLIHGVSEENNRKQREVVDGQRQQEERGDRVRLHPTDRSAHPTRPPCEVVAPRLAPATISG